MDDIGQISVEYLLLIVVVLIIISSVTIPLIGQSVDASNDVSNVADAKNAVNELANGVNIIYANGPGAKRTLNVYIPQNMTLQNGTNIITLNATAKTVNSTVEYPVNIINGTLTKNWYTATIQWNPGSSTITITMKKS
jgi:uncharacterized protein (UPF0333 family)